MKFKSYLYFDKDKLVLEWTDKPVSFNGIELGKITGSKYNRETNSVELTMKIHEDKVEEVKKLLVVNKVFIETRGSYIPQNSEIPPQPHRIN